MWTQRLRIIDIWLLALANVSVHCLLVLLGVNELASDEIWYLGYWAGSVFCFAFWLALGTAQWWQRVGQALLVTSGPLLSVWLQQSSTGSWVLLLGFGSGVFALLRFFRLRVAVDENATLGDWRFSLSDLLVLMAVTGVAYKVWQAECMFGPKTLWQRWDETWRDLGAYGVLASHGVLLIAPTLWLLLRPQRLSILAGLLALLATLLLAAFACWLIPIFLNGRWELPAIVELWDFWLRYVWKPQLALVSVAIANALTWRLLGWRLIRVRPRSPALPSSA